MASFIAIPPEVMARPYCPKCGAQMWLARIYPDKPGYDQRTYECPDCQHEVTEHARVRGGRGQAVLDGELWPSDAIS